MARAKEQIDDEPKATSSGCLCCKRKRRSVPPPHEDTSSVLAPVPHPTSPSRPAVQHDVERALPTALVTAGGQSDSTRNESPKTPTVKLEDEMRTQLAYKNEELLEAVAKQQQLEEALSQTRLERQALHGEVRLLHQQLAHLHSCIGEDKRLRETAERLQAEATLRAREAEQHMHDADDRRREAEAMCSAAQKRTQDAEYAREEAEMRSKAANARATDAERQEAELLQRLQECESEWKSRMDTKARELELRCSELDLQRQSDIRSGLLELHALAQGQQTLRTHILRTQSPRALNFVGSGIKNGVHSSRLHTGFQPWELWELTSDRIRDNTCIDFDSNLSFAPLDRSGLLNGRVKDQADFLDKQIRELESRQLSTMSTSTSYPPW